MIIKDITLTNFRNHDSYHLECNPTTTLILGENGWGKTSILEAIYILTNGKSFRATDPDILKRGEDFYRIVLNYDNGESVIASYDTKAKTFIAKDKKTRRLPKKSKYPTILFLPSDLNIISGSPSRHREYFDRYFGQLYDDYSINLSRYEKALRQRNELLKQENLPESAVFSWNLLLSRYGTMVANTRRNLVNKINQNITDTYHSIAKNQDIVRINYNTEISDINEATYLSILENNFKKDSFLGHTSFGIHRDDFEFLFNDQKANGSASRGETRSIILALKFLEANDIYDIYHEKPIILLDDVFSELDEGRRKCLIDNFKDNQVIITSVEAINN